MDSGRSGQDRGWSRRRIELEAEARYARERLQLYRARAYGPRMTNAGRLRELERESKLADRLLQQAKVDHGLHRPKGTHTSTCDPARG
jgi:hypothetical protein